MSDVWNNPPGHRTGPKHITEYSDSDKETKVMIHNVRDHNGGKRWMDLIGQLNERDDVVDLKEENSALEVVKSTLYMATGIFLVLYGFVLKSDIAAIVGIFVLAIELIHQRR